MDVKEAIEKLIEAKNPYNQDSLDLLSNTEIDEVISLLRELEKYKEMWGEAKRKCIGFSWAIYKCDLTEIEQKYFPKEVEDEY